MVEGLEIFFVDKNGEKFIFIFVIVKYIKLDIFGMDVNNWSVINEIVINSVVVLFSWVIK